MEESKNATIKEEDREERLQRLKERWPDLFEKGDVEIQFCETLDEFFAPIMKEQQRLIDMRNAPVPGTEILDVGDVKKWHYAPLHWYVDELIQRGALIFVGATSQTGKTLLWLYTLQQILKPGMLFGRFKISPVESVAYFALEDPIHRLQNRLIEYCWDHLDPGRYRIYLPRGMSLTDERWTEWLEGLMDARRFEVAVIDTYQRCTPGLSSFNDEQQSLILHRLSGLTRKYKVTLIILDHLRKQDSRFGSKAISMQDIKGTGGKAQNADSVILMERKGSQITLRAQNKDLDHQIAFLLDVAPEGSRGEKFRFAGDLYDKESQSYIAVLNKIREAESWVSSGEILSATRLSIRTIQRHIQELLAANVICREGNGKSTRYRALRQQDNDFN